jgi:hypothetical protein
MKRLKGKVLEGRELARRLNSAYESIGPGGVEPVTLPIPYRQERSQLQNSS